MPDQEEQPRPAAASTVGSPVDAGLVTRSRRTLGTVLLGAGLAVLSTAASVIGRSTYPQLVGGVGRGEAQVAVIVAIVLLVIIIVQAVGWAVAGRVWSGRSRLNLQPLGAVSYVAHLLSYPAVLVGMWEMLSAMVIAHVQTMSFWMFAVGLVALVAAQIIGATEYLRRSGPPGTLPAHLRRLVELSRARNEAP